MKQFTETIQTDYTNLIQYFYENCDTSGIKSMERKASLIHDEISHKRISTLAICYDHSFSTLRPYPGLIITFVEKEEEIVMHVQTLSLIYDNTADKKSIEIFYKTLQDYKEKYM